MNDDTGWWLDEYDHDRFWANVDRNGGTAYLDDPLATASGQCWEWTGAISGDGYSNFWLYGKMTAGHRIAYLDGGRKNSIPDGWVIDHLCRNTRCVNPKHLEPCTFQENIDRGLKGKANITHCPSGHAYDEQNTKQVRRGDKTIRYCKICTSASRNRAKVRRSTQDA